MTITFHKELCQIRKHVCKIVKNLLFTLTSENFDSGINGGNHQICPPPPLKYIDFLWARCVNIVVQNCVKLWQIFETGDNLDRPLLKCHYSKNIENFHVNQTFWLTLYKFVWESFTRISFVLC